MTDMSRPTLDDKGLRQFAAIFAGVICIVFGGLFPYLLEKPTPSWPWALGSVVLVWGLGFPATFRHFYRLWMRFGHLMNAIITRVVLAVVFYVVILPIGLWMRLRSKDPLRRRWDNTTLTYRVKSVASPPSQMERPF